MGKLPKAGRKSQTISVYLTIKQEEALSKMAEKAETTVSNYLRELILLKIK